MSLQLFIEQLLNGIQFGFMLFLMSAGSTLIFGVMGLINLAHGSFFMIGAFSASFVAGLTGNFFLAIFRPFQKNTVSLVWLEACRLTAAFYKQ